MSSESKCPFQHGSQATVGTQSNRDWWPNQLNLKILHQHTPESSPLTTLNDCVHLSPKWIPAPV